MGGQHDELFLSGSPPILYIYIHMYMFLMAAATNYDTVAEAREEGGPLQI